MKILLKPWGLEGGPSGFSWLTFVVAQPDRLSDPHDVWMGECGPVSEQSGVAVTHGWC